MKKLSAKDLLNLFGNSKNAVKCDKFDIEAFQEVKKYSKGLLQAEKEGKEADPAFSDLLQDMRDILYKPKPVLAEEFELTADHLLNYELAKQLIEHRRVKEIRTASVLDDTLSGLGTEMMAPEMVELMKQMKEQKKALNDMLEAAKDAQEAAQQGQGQGEGEGEGEGEEDGAPGGNKPGSGGENLTLEAAKKRLEEARKAVQEAFNDPKFQNNLGQALGRVKHKVIETSDMIKSWGLGNDAHYAKSAYREKMDLMHRLQHSQKLKQIAALLGRMSALALSAQNQKVRRGFDEVYSVELGRDLERMLPQELIKLADPQRRLEFLLNYSEGRCLQYALKGKEKKAKGAIVVCLDESGSMSGEPEVWSKAVAIALLQIATRQKRDFHVVHFAGDSNWKNLPTHTFPKEGPLNAVKLIEMAEHFICGGTDFEAPLTAARKKIETQEQFHKADIVFITDGECAVRNDWLKDFNKWRKDKAVSVYSILMNCGYNSTASLKEFSTSVSALSDLTGKQSDEIVLDIFMNI